MTRGLGRLQREIYDALPYPEKHWVLLSDLYGPDPTPARAESVRRAVRGLQRRGLVEVAWADRPLGTGKGARPRRVRLALTREEQAQARRELAKMEADLEAMFRGELPPGYDALGRTVAREEHE
jgi:hypothetical protein